jgi:DNA-binding PadR family transcriptional regulator
MSATDSEKLTLEGQLLLEILGWSDALFWPTSDLRAPWQPHVTVAKRKYPLQGVPWRSTARGDNKLEQARGRALRRLQQHKLVQIIRARGKATRISHVKLTDAGEQEAGRLLNDDRAYSAQLFCEEARRLTEGQRLWIPEIAFNEGKGWPDASGAEFDHDEMAVIARTAASALMRGLVVAECSGRGRIYYSLTDEGMKCPPPAPEPEFHDEDDRELWAIYEAAFDDALTEWHAKEGYSQDIGSIGILDVGLAEVTKRVLAADAARKAKEEAP